MNKSWWIPVKTLVPDIDMDSFDVTIETPDGTRLTNIAIYRKKTDEWELMIDKHHFRDCKVIAWQPRVPIYKGP